MEISQNIENTPVPALEGEFTVSDAAAARIVKILAGEPEGSKLRISVLGGGCSGFQYQYDFEAKPAGLTDIIIEKNGATVVIDDLSIGFVAGSVLDFVEDLSSAGFEIKNPNATAKCGCGNSFAV
jgi:iron-sulfur cluster assembly accessory protein